MKLPLPKKKKLLWNIQTNLEGIGHAIDEEDPHHFVQEIRILYPKLEQYGMRMPMIEPVKIGKAEYDSTWHGYHITFLKCLRRYGRYKDFSLNQWNDDVDKEADKRRRHVIEASSRGHGEIGPVGTTVEKAEMATLPLIPILAENKTSLLVAVHGSELDEVKLCVNKQPHAEDLQWTDGGKEFRTIVQNMKVFAELCDVRFSCQDGRPAFGFRYRISGADWLEVYMHGDGPGTEHSGKAVVRVAVLSHERGTELHDLTLEGVWFGDDTGPEWPFEAELRLWYEGVQMLPPFHRYERGFWSKRQASDTEADRCS